MRITIVGATGFIGKHLTKYLAELDYEVDTLSRAEFMNQDWGRLDDFQYRTESDATLRKKADIAVKPDVVVHCAWIRDKDLDTEKHLEFATWTCNFYDECKKRGIRVINLGSSSEYGMHLEKMNEGTSVCIPHTTYGIAKLMVTLYAKKLGFNTLRLFAVTGEGGHSFNDIYEDADKWGSPLDNRHFVKIKMVCKAVERLMHAQHIYGEIINIAGTHRTYEELAGEDRYPQSVEEFARNMINGKMPNNKWLKYPQRQYEPYRWEADLTKMKELLNL